jgi:hypothetical protein
MGMEPASMGLGERDKIERLRAFAAGSTRSGLANMIQIICATLFGEIHD